MGQTADVLRARLGCRATGRSLDVRAVGPLPRAALGTRSPSSFPAVPPLPPRGLQIGGSRLDDYCFSLTSTPFGPSVNFTPVPVAVSWITTPF
jgi:hypothetical protein